MANKTFKLYADKMGGKEATSYIGNEGEIFYDPTTTSLRISDGVTPGGGLLPTGGGSSNTLTTGSNTLSYGAGVLTNSTDYLTITSADGVELNSDSGASVAVDGSNVNITATELTEEDELLNYNWQFAYDTLFAPATSEIRSSLGEITLSTADADDQIARRSYSAYYSDTSNNAFINHGVVDASLGQVNLYLVTDPDTNERYVNISTYDGGAVYGTSSWKFHQSGKIETPNIFAPTTSIGAAGDKQGMLGITTTYLYYCTADYDGESNIWKRIAWPSETW